jgi:intermembrane space import and assembly protein 40
MNLFSEMTQDSTMSPPPSLPLDSSSEFSTLKTKPPDSFIPDPEQPDAQNGSPEETSGETSEPSGSGGAFNPQTGEINWDCPCLGGMAHGPCGPEFREAFSCFVFSEVEPKGIDCVEKFKAMQSCFRAHPDVYADGVYPSVKVQIYLTCCSRNYG